MSYNEDAGLLKQLKGRNNGLVTVVFGSHPTFMPVHALTRDGVDIIVRREPEYVIRDLARNIKKGGASWKGSLGIGFRDNGRHVVNADYPFIGDLDELPFLDVDMLPKNIDYFNPIVSNIPYITITS